MKTCPDCGRRMNVLLQWTWYCPHCEQNGPPPEDPWDIEYKSPKDCYHEPKYHYVMDDRLFCRACGELMQGDKANN